MRFFIKSFIFVMNLACRRAALAKLKIWQPWKPIKEAKDLIKDGSSQPNTNSDLIDRINVLMSIYSLFPFIFTF